MIGAYMLTRRHGFSFLHLSSAWHFYSLNIRQVIRRMHMQMRLWQLDDFGNPTKAEVTGHSYIRRRVAAAVREWLECLSIFTLHCVCLRVSSKSNSNPQFSMIPALSYDHNALVIARCHVWRACTVPVDPTSFAAVHIESYKTSHRT